MYIVGRPAHLLRVDPNHPSISEDGREFFLHSAQNYGHDTAINPIIVWLTFLCVFWFLIKCRKLKKRNEYLGYCVASFLSFLLFMCALRWEPFVTRYMISYLALLCPAVAVMVQKLASFLPNKYKISCIAIIIFVCMVEMTGLFHYHVAIFKNQLSAPSAHGYFTNRPGEYDTYVALCDLIIEKNYQNIGLYIGEDTYEYPLWVMLENNIVSMQHVNVQNQSSQYQDISFVPDCIIGINKKEENDFTYHGIVYADKVSIGDNCILYSRGQ